ncbi:MAG TPA: nitroreductase family protein [Candidatus Lokiarchaeia archaeon]|nr:nitroreductase family protein [Candidatus Lokiarchaeia archaeon]
MGGKDSQAHEFNRAFKEIVESRRSYKLPFSSKNVDPEMIERCIDLARWAPSAHNEQPWRFIIFYRQDETHVAIRGKMLDAMGARYTADLLAGDQTPGASKGRASNTRLRQAPVLILALLDGSVMDMYPDEPRQAAEQVMGEQSVAACLQTLLLALHVAGLKACWFCAPLFAGTAIQEELRLPETLIPQAFIATGYGGSIEQSSFQRPDGRMAGSTRKEVSEVILSPLDFLHHVGDDHE